MPKAGAAAGEARELGEEVPSSREHWAGRRPPSPRGTAGWEGRSPGQYTHLPSASRLGTLACPQRRAAPAGLGGARSWGSLGEPCQPPRPDTLPALRAGRGRAGPGGTYLGRVRRPCVLGVLRRAAELLTLPAAAAGDPA